MQSELFVVSKCSELFNWQIFLYLLTCFRWLWRLPYSFARSIQNFTLGLLHLCYKWTPILMTCALDFSDPFFMNFLMVAGPKNDGCWVILQGILCLSLIFILSNLLIYSSREYTLKPKNWRWLRDLFGWLLSCSED